MIDVMSAAFAAGETKTFQVPAEYFELLDLPYTVDVLLMMRDGTQVSRMMKGEASYFMRPGRFETFTITSQQAQTVRWFVGSGDAGTRKAAGTVQVVDAGRLETLAGANYSAGQGVGSAAGSFPMIQIWNPAGSGARAILKGMVYGTDRAAILFGHISAVPRATNVANAIANRLAGGVATSMQLRIDNTLTGVPADLNGVAAQFYENFNGADKDQHRFAEPLVLLPGYGFTYWSNTVSGPTLHALIEFKEETI